VAPIPDDARSVLATARARLDESTYLALERTARDYAHWWSTHFSIEHDPSALDVESNVFRYRTLPRGVLVVVDESTDPLDVERARLAAAICRAPVRVVDADRIAEISDPSDLPDRVRLLTGDDADEVWAWAAKVRVHIDDQPMLEHGRLELWRWLREQSLTETMHRMGTILGRARDRLSPDR
jgi:RHH-type proline utilization regulon transcriptional repressor/proline dehydrogenase/delta 1-pyrroline-5-carboxylate dehydrogenase